MSTQAPSTASRQIVWQSVITVISAAILIGAEVFGAAFAGGWALAILLPPESLYLPFTQETWAHIVQAVLFLLHSDYVTGVVLPVDGGRLIR